MPFCYQEEGVDLNHSIQTCVGVKLVEPQWNGQQQNCDHMVKHDDPGYAGKAVRVHPNPEQVRYYVTEHHVSDFGGIIVPKEASNRQEAYDRKRTQVDPAETIKCSDCVVRSNCALRI